MRLLEAMVRNKVASHARREQAKRRDNRRLEAGGDAEREAVSPDHSPSQLVSQRELLEAVRKRLSSKERQLFDLIREGHEWPQIAAQLNESAEALRKRLERGLRRVKHALGL